MHKMVGAGLVLTIMTTCRELRMTTSPLYPCGQTQKKQRMWQREAYAEDWTEAGFQSVKRSMPKAQCESTDRAGSS